MDEPKPRTSMPALVGSILLIGAAGYLLLPPPRPAYRRSACVSNLRQVGLALALYAQENNDMYPPLDDRPGNLTFDGNVLFPEYLTDINLLGCPSDPSFDPRRSFRLAGTNTWYGGFVAGEPNADCIDSSSYGYIPWVIENETAANSDDTTRATFAALRELMQQSDEPIDASGTPQVATDAWRDAPLDLAAFGFTGSGNAGGDTLLRLRIGVELFFFPDVKKPMSCSASAGSGAIPIIWDQISTDIAEFSHVPAGQNVLFLDGHVEFIRYTESNTRFPTTPLFATLNSQFTPAAGDPNTPWADCP